MIDWVKDAGILWGIQQRRLEFGGYFHTDGAFHFDGSAARSVAGKLYEEREGAGGGSTRQHFAECLTGEALLFRRAIQGMPEARFTMLFYHYVVPREWMSKKEKVNALMGAFPDVFKNRQSYYDEMDRTHERIAGIWPTLVPHGTISSDNVAA